MSSTPARGSPGKDGDIMTSTPPSSPPSRGEEEEEDDDDDDADFDPRAERMAEEENRLRQQARKEEEEEKKRSRDWVKANKGEQKTQFNKLMHLVEQSKVFATIMQKRMQQEETKNHAKSESERKKLEKQEARREQVAIDSQRKVTRQSKPASSDPPASTASPSNTLPTRGRGRPAQRGNGKISDWLKKEDVSKKAGDVTVAEAIAEAAEDPEAQSGSFGARNLRSDNQPKELTGGIMRSYQLEGLYWLRSLYENGLNGILADEMGLGKTIQTISFLAFLREMKSFGPFLIVAPLSTLSNWIDEFAKWTPTINTVLYHGTPTDRANIRSKKLRKPGTESFPVVCTSYEICMNDRKFLSQYGWKFIIIDEGHRLKNLNCRLIKELKQYESANRLLITGTPLQNNLAELWSLLNFLMPEVFDTLENFESFFDFSAVLSKGGHREIIEREEQNNLIASLHAILKPFLLRRVKTDVETDLPPKREYILYAPLTAPQKELYRHILEGTSRSYLEGQAVNSMLAKNTKLKGKRSAASLKRKLAADSESSTPNKSAKSSRASTPASARGSRKGTSRRVNYAEVSDQQYFRELEHESTSVSEPESDEDEEERELAKTIQLAKREIGGKKLQNPIMQLRLACNSPHNFYWPFADEADDSIVRESGKMLLLERLVPYLFARGHKVLIFSQFKTQLDILEEWASSLHGWHVCRVDGGVSHNDRKEQIRDFNTRDDVQLFLLSTRAGGQGINLAAADTVILFDSDWNPQQDLQAQDRAHRIGQTRPVIVYRLATRGTVEQTLLEKADGKRRLEKLVIRKGKFRSLRDAGQDDLHELARLLETDDGEQLDVQGEGTKLLSNRDLDTLVDRSAEAYARAARGEEAGEMFRAVETQKDVGVLAEMSTR